VNESTAYIEAKTIAQSAYRSHEIWVDRWLWGFDVPNLFVVAGRNASPNALAVLIAEQVAIHRAQQTSEWAQQAIQAALLKSPPLGGVQ
jgi:hypothetical protein